MRALSRTTFVADNPADGPRIDSNASDMSLLLMPFRYRNGDQVIHAGHAA
jgi:hypothetical protein